MDLDAFQKAVARVRAEQFLREKAASAQPAALGVVRDALLEQVEDRSLLKMASTYCPLDPFGMYVKLGGQFKTAEPPPPAGVSSKEWDKVLSKGPTKSMETGSSSLIRRSQVKYRP